MGGFSKATVAPSQMAAAHASHAHTLAASTTQGVSPSKSKATTAHRPTIRQRRSSLTLFQLQEKEKEMEQYRL